MTAAIFALKNADPDEWQDRYYTETRVNVSIESTRVLAIIAGARTPVLIKGKPVETAMHAPRQTDLLRSSGAPHIKGRLVVTLHRTVFP